MSASPIRFPTPLAWDLAERLWQYFAPVCHPMRYDITGSLRRLRDHYGYAPCSGFERHTVGDIDLVLDLTVDVSVFKARLARLPINNHTGKERKHSFILKAQGVEIPVQIHLATTHSSLTWGTVNNYGWLMVLNTGDEDFNRLLVSPQPYGLRPSHIHKAEGGPTEGFLHVGGIPQHTPTEHEVFALHRLGYVRPSRRNAQTAHHLAGLLKQEAAAW
jgi:DNA polymerase/3'-5' exonuclease PolX